MKRTASIAGRAAHRPWVAELGPWLWFSVLAFAITAPLLGKGFLLLLDWPSGPELPRVPLLPLPSSGDLGSGTPFLALLALLRSIHPYLPDKVLLVAPIVLGGVGMFRLVRSRFGVGSAAAAYGATLFVFNPFVADRFLAGHLFFLLAFALLPWAVGPVLDLLDEPSGRVGVWVGLWLFGLAAIDLHVAGMYGLLVVAAGVTGLTRRGAISAAIGLGIGAALCAYWVLPSLFVAPGSGIGTADLAAYATRPPGMGVLPTLAGLYGFWRDEFAGPAERIPTLYLLLVPILALSLTGAIRVLASERRRRAGIVLVAGAVLGLLLAGGTSFPPTAGAFRWLFDNVAFFRIYREPQKFLALLVLVYATFGAVGLQAVVTRAGRTTHARSWGASVSAICVACVYAYTMLWGFWGQVHLSRYPSDWARAEQIMDAEGPGRVLVLPWHLYAVLSFSDGRIVANPAPSFFSREVIAGDNVGFPTIPTQSVDPFSAWVQEILTHRREVREVGHLVAPLDIRFIVLLEEADPDRYRFLERQSDLTTLYKGTELQLFENGAWRGRVLPLEAASDERSSPPAWERAAEATKRLLPAAARAPVARGSFPLLGRLVPGWRSVNPVPDTYVATGDRCTDGWRLGEEEPLCHLGAVAAFPSPDEPETLRRPLAGGRIAGVLVSGLTLVGALSYGRRAGAPTRRREAE
jgi:hypothetical protein